MNANRNFIDEIKYQYQYGGMAIKLIFINTFVFLFIGVFGMINQLMTGNSSGYLLDNFQAFFYLYTDLGKFIRNPWGLITSIFSHFGFFHLLMNMIFLYFAGKLFTQLFDNKRLLYTYLLGGIAGGVIEILAYNIFPGLQGAERLVVGASGSIMAIFVAIAFYRPNTVVNLFGILPVRIIFLALVFIVIDFLSLGQNDGTAHFAHLGGALIGIWSIQNLHSNKNIVTITQKWGDKLIQFFQRLNKPKKTKFKVQTGGRVKKTDEEYNLEKKLKQEKIDAILDKISKSGYESLSKAEKAFLFSQSNND
jgi:membrane associated rhomboid family serine protease